MKCQHGFEKCAMCHDFTENLWTNEDSSVLPHRTDSKPPITKGDCGAYEVTIGLTPAEDVKVMWDKRGFAVIDLGCGRQLPVYELEGTIYLTDL